MKTLVTIGGVFALAFFVFHVFFWKLFDWNEDLKKVSQINKGVMQVLNLCLMVVFLIFGYVSIFHADEMLATGLGNALLGGIAALWFLRAIQQIIFFGLKSGLSITFFAIFLLGSALYMVPLMA